MNKLLSLLLIVFTFSACTKENNTITVKQKLVGTWELEQVVCGECINSITNFAPGNGRVLVINSNSSFEQKDNATVLAQGSYTVEKNNVCQESSNGVLFSTFQNGNKLDYEVNVDNNKLVLRTPSCFTDGATSTYRKIN